MLLVGHPKGIEKEKGGRRKKGKKKW